jgi:integrase
MPSIKPIHTAIRAASATSSDTWYSIVGHRGLWLRARPGMPKTWVFRSTVGGKTSKVVLGRYPEMEFDDARRTMDALKESAGGANPIEAMRQRDRTKVDQATAASNAALLRPSLSAFAKRYLGVFVGERRRAEGEKRSAAEDRRLFTKHVEPLLGSMKLEDIRTKDIAAMRNAITAPSERRKAIAVVRALLSHAKSDGLVEHNPALGVKAPPSGTRDRKLSDDELRVLWNGLSAPMDAIRTSMLDALRVQLLTAQRIGEVLAMQWHDLGHDGRTWLIPSEVAKNGRENLVPLSPLAWEIVQAQERATIVRKPSATDEEMEKLRARARFVFPGHRVSPVSSSAFAQLVERMRLTLQMEDFTSHDLRRTAATRMAGLGILPHVVEAILNHASGTISGVAAIYNRHNYAPEKKRALLAWSREIERIANNKPKIASVTAISSRESG